MNIKYHFGLFFQLNISNLSYRRRIGGYRPVEDSVAEIPPVEFVNKLVDVWLKVFYFYIVVVFCEILFDVASRYVKPPEHCLGQSLGGLLRNMCVKALGDIHIWRAVVGKAIFFLAFVIKYRKRSVCFFILSVSRKHLLAYSYMGFAVLFMLGYLLWYKRRIV